MGNTGKAIFILMVVVLCCVSQQTHRRWLIAPNPATTSNPDEWTNGINAWWIATNLYTPITQWNDCISGYVWGISTASKQPKWTNGFGVYFDGSDDVLTNNNTIYNGHTTNTGSTGGSYFIVTRFDTLAATYSAPIMANANVYPSLISYTKKWQSGNNVSYVQCGTNVTGAIQDYCYAGCVGTNHYFYTNGVLALVTNVGPGSWVVTLVGYYSGSGSGMKGAIYEYIYWTNAGCLTSNEVMAVHQSCTNRHVYSP